MCKILKVSASGFYGWRHRPVCQRQQANAALTAQIREAFVASDQTYGMPRIRAELQDAGIVASRKRIARLILLCFQRYRCYPFESRKTLHSFGV
jgi:putative transposase